MCGRNGGDRSRTSFSSSQEGLPSPRDAVAFSMRDVQSILTSIKSIKIEIEEHTAPLIALTERLGQLERKLSGEEVDEKQPSRRRRNVTHFLSFLEGKVVARTIFLLSVVWQALNLLLVEAVEDWDADSWTAVMWTMLAFQLVHVIFMVVISVKLVHQVIHRSVNILFIIQSYLSTIVMFGGVYTLMCAFPPHFHPFKFFIIILFSHHLNREAFQGVEMTGTIGQLTFEWYIDFLVFSIGIMSAGTI